MRTDRWTDGRNEANSRFLQMNAPKNNGRSDKEINNLYYALYMA
jgi:hypothetical protein